MAIIKLKNITKRYGEKSVLKDFSLIVNEGDYISITGASGKGKTTILNIIGMLDEPSSGTVEVCGYKNPKTYSRQTTMIRRYELSYLFQNYGLIEDESVLWNLKLALEYKKVKKEEKLKLINKYLKQFELSDMLNKKVYQLSGGEQQRIAIIKLILQGSQIILADEPTSGLDKENELIVMKLLKELNEKGITIIMVTHNMNLCDCFSRVINVENFR